MARNAITQDFYDRMLAAFREAPGNVQRCCRNVKCDRRTARRGWHDGWPERGFPPISQVLESEQIEARHRLNRARDSELDVLKKQQNERLVQSHNGAEQDASASRAEDVQVVRAARSNAMGLLVLTQKMLRGAHKLGAKLEEELGGTQLKPTQVVSLFKEISTMARSSNETAKIAMAMERSLLGEPDKIIGHKFVPMSVEEATREIEAANRSLKRLRQEGTVVSAIAAPADAESAPAE